MISLWLRFCFGKLFFNGQDNESGSLGKTEFLVEEKEDDRDMSLDVADAEQRDGNEQKREEVREKYNPDNIFKKQHQENGIEENIIQNEVALVEYKESIFKRFINKLKSIILKLMINKKNKNVDTARKRAK